MKPDEIKTETKADWPELFRCFIDDVLRILWLLVLLGWLFNGWNL